MSRQSVKQRLIRGLLVMLMVMSPLLWADEAGNAAADAADNNSGIAWGSLSSQEQQLLTPFAKQWATLPPERQQRLRKGIQRWSQMSPAERTRGESGGWLQVVSPRP